MWWRLRCFLVTCLLANGLSGCAGLPVTDFDYPEVELHSLKPVAANGMEARFEITLRVTNPNALTLDLEGIYFELLLRDHKVLSGTSAHATTLPAYGDALLPLEASIGLFNALGLIRELSERPAEPGAGLPYRLNTKLSLRNFPTALRLEHEGVLSP